MTAAHKTLPLPCLRARHQPAQRQSVVVRINDRGPFVANRLIDLSYTAAAKLDMLREGTTLVEVRTLTPGAPDELTRSAADAAAGTVRAGRRVRRRGQRAAAARAAAGRGASATPSCCSPVAGRSHLFRVRVGPVTSVADFDQLAARLQSLGIPDARLAND